MTAFRITVWSSSQSAEFYSQGDLYGSGTDSKTQLVKVKLEAVEEDAVESMPHKPVELPGLARAQVTVAQSQQQVHNM